MNIAQKKTNLPNVDQAMATLKAAYIAVGYWLAKLPPWAFREETRRLLERAVCDAERELDGAVARAFRNAGAELHRRQRAYRRLARLRAWRHVASLRRQRAAN